MTAADIEGTQSPLGSYFVQLHQKVSLEGTIISEGIQPTFGMGLAIIFSTFYNFNLQYQEEAFHVGVHSKALHRNQSRKGQQGQKRRDRLQENWESDSKKFSESTSLHPAEKLRDFECDFNVELPRALKTL
ncbi:hypothetical protein WMY93_022077 [Mugilogobius chulae]|uniref:Uncharacterized protein n=1 Tax=Mugilogobius chulae TaxID=88201 RepID=A0AAW0NCI6_9GOBI